MKKIKNQNKKNNFGKNQIRNQNKLKMLLDLVKDLKNQDLFEYIKKKITKLIK